MFRLYYLTFCLRDRILLSTKSKKNDVFVSGPIPRNMHSNKLKALAYPCRHAEKSQ